MIRTNEIVSHDGKTYNPGEEIEKIEKEQAQRLVDLGIAFFVGEKAPIDPKEVKEELDAIDYNDLKSVSKDIGLDFPGNISKANLINLIIEQEKDQEVLELTEDDE